MNIAARGRGPLALAVVGALALVLLAAVLATHDDPEVSLTAAGPPSPAGEVGPVPPPVPEEPATTTTTQGQLRVDAIHGRTSPPQPAPSSVPPPDDPVVRMPTTVPSGSARSPVAPEPPAGMPPTTVAAGACPASGVRVSVVTAPTYASGETVRGSTIIENRSATTCSLPTRGFVRILNAAGKDVSRFAYTMEYRFPVSAEVGKTFTTPFTWDQRDCTGAACVQVPAGTYTVVADWTEGGSYSGQGSFQIRA